MMEKKIYPRKINLLLALLGLGTLSGCNLGSSSWETKTATYHQQLKELSYTASDLGAPAVRIGVNGSTNIYGSIKEADRQGCFDPKNTFASVEDSTTKTEIFMFQSMADIQNHLAINTSVNGSYGLFNASASVDYQHNISIQENSVNFMYYTTHSFNLTLLPKNNDILQSMYPDKAALYKDSSTRNSFYEQCGSAYAQKVGLGVMTQAQISIQFNDKTEEQSVKADLGMSYGSFADFSSHVEKSEKLKNSSAKVSIILYSYGVHNTAPLNTSCSLQTFKQCEKWMNDVQETLSKQSITAINTAENDYYYKGQGKYRDLTEIAGSGLNYMGITSYATIDGNLDNIYRPSQTFIDLRDSVANNYKKAIDLRYTLNQRDDFYFNTKVIDYTTQLQKYISAYENNLKSIQYACYNSLPKEENCRNLVTKLDGGNKDTQQDLTDTSLLNKISIFLQSTEPSLYDNEFLHNVAWVAQRTTPDYVYYTAKPLNGYLKSGNKNSSPYSYVSAYVAYDRYQPNVKNNQLDTYWATDISAPERMAILKVPAAALSSKSSNGNYTAELSFFNPTSANGTRYSGTFVKGIQIPLNKKTLPGSTQVQLDIDGVYNALSFTTSNGTPNGSLISSFGKPSGTTRAFPQSSYYLSKPLTIDPDECRTSVIDALAENDPVMEDSRKKCTMTLWEPESHPDDNLPGFDPNLFTNIRTTNEHVDTLNNTPKGFTDPYAALSMVKSYLANTASVMKIPLNSERPINRDFWPKYNIDRSENYNVENSDLLDVNECLLEPNPDGSLTKAAWGVFESSGKYYLKCGTKDSMIPKGNFLNSCILNSKRTIADSWKTLYLDCNGKQLEFPIYEKGTTTSDSKNKNPQGCTKSDFLTYDKAKDSLFCLKTADDTTGYSKYMPKWNPDYSRKQGFYYADYYYQHGRVYNIDDIVTTTYSEQIPICLSDDKSISTNYDGNYHWLKYTLRCLQLLPADYVRPIEPSDYTLITGQYVYKPNEARPEILSNATGLLAYDYNPYSKSFSRLSSLVAAGVYNPDRGNNGNGGDQIRRYFYSSTELGYSFKWHSDAGRDGCTAVGDNLDGDGTVTFKCGSQYTTVNVTTFYTDFNELEKWSGMITYYNSYIDNLTHWYGRRNSDGSGGRNLPPGSWSHSCTAISSVLNVNSTAPYSNFTVSCEGDPAKTYFVDLTRKYYNDHGTLKLD